ncbi:hypothetical protein WMF37_38360 [Sorangium sp. So ce291]|uniref:hypothetical protein n=1 Tax=Sorangium sp. So ce291 TaxID=3133294 RepID=UPI003EFEC641
MRRAVKDIAGFLERAEILDPDTAVRGYIGDQQVTVVLTQKEHGDLDLRSTEATVPVEDGILINFSIRPLTSQDRRETQRGLTVTHRTGDASFDDAFVVEGAPERLIREIVDDEEVRRDLLALKPDNVLTTPTAWIVHLYHWVEDPAEAAIMVRLAARIGALTSEIARRQRADVGRLDTSGFRGALPLGTRERDEEELQQFRLRMAKRHAHRRRAAIRLAAIILASLLAGGIALALFAR